MQGKGIVFFALLWDAKLFGNGVNILEAAWETGIFWWNDFVSQQITKWECHVIIKFFYPVIGENCSAVSDLASWMMQTTFILDASMPDMPQPVVMGKSYGRNTEEDVVVHPLGEGANALHMHYVSGSISHIAISASIG